MAFNVHLVVSRADNPQVRGIREIHLFKGRGRKKDKKRMGGGTKFQ